MHCFWSHQRCESIIAVQVKQRFMANGIFQTSLDSEPVVRITRNDELKQTMIQITRLNSRKNLSKCAKSFEDIELRVKLSKYQQLVKKISDNSIQNQYQRNKFFVQFCKGLATELMRIMEFYIINYKDIKFTQVTIQLNSMIFPNKVLLNKCIDLHLVFLIGQRIHEFSDANQANSNCYSYLKTALNYSIRVKLRWYGGKNKNYTAFNNFQILLLLHIGLLSSIIMNLLSEQ